MNDKIQDGKAADSDSRDPESVKRMFSRVAKFYDPINHAMCFGLDILWRRALVKKLSINSDFSKTARFADLACGSGDVSIEILRRFPNAEVVGGDFCAEMLARAKAKLSASKYSNRAKFVLADCQKLPFRDGEFDGAAISFGFRNFKDRENCLKDIARTLKSGSVLAILEVSRATGAFAKIQAVFMRIFVPAVARIIGGSIKDYQYLAETTMKYPNATQVESMFSKAGFGNVKTEKHGFGLVAITYGRKI